MTSHLRTPVKTERGTVLRADFHVHAFPGDGLLPAWELADEANRRGIDVVAITNHNQTLAASFAARRSGRLPLVLPGQEVTSPSFHLVAVGVREVVDWRLPLGGVIDAIHAQGGVAIAAHPVRHSWHADPESAAALDGSEAMHSLSATDPAAASSSSNSTAPFACASRHLRPSARLTSMPSRRWAEPRRIFWLTRSPRGEC